MPRMTRLGAHSARVGDGDGYWLALVGSSATRSAAYSCAWADDRLIAVGEIDIATDVAANVLTFTRSGSLNVASKVLVSGNNNWIVAATDDRAGNAYALHDGGSETIRKFDASGSLWANDGVYAFGSSDSIAVASAGLFVAGGYYPSGLRRYDPANGSLLWETSGLSAQYVAADASAAYTLTAFTATTAQLTKVAAAGTLVWGVSMTCATSTNLHASVIACRGGYVYACINLDGTRTMIAKFTDAGAFVWSVVVNGAFIRSIDVDGSDNVYVSIGADIMSFDSSGTLRWARSFNAVSMNVRVGPSGLAAAGYMYFTDALHPSDADTSALIAKLPLDGSGTGSYPLGTGTVIYTAMTPTFGSDTITTSSYTPSFTLTYPAQTVAPDAVTDSGQSRIIAIV